MTTYEKIPEIIKLNNIVQWKIRKSKSDVNSFLFITDDNKTVEANIEDMNRLFTWEFGDYYILDASRHVAKSVGTGRFLFEFSNKRTAESPQTQQIIQQPSFVGSTNTGITEEELNRRIELATREIESKYKAEALKEEKKYFEEERKEFYKERDTGLNLLLTKIGSVVLPLLNGGQQIATQGITGTPQEESNVVIDRDNSPLNNSAEELINEWMSIDNEAISLLAKIVNIAKTNPTMYNMAKTMLTNQ